LIFPADHPTMDIDSRRPGITLEEREEQDG